MRPVPFGVRIVLLVAPLALLPLMAVGSVAYYYLDSEVRTNIRATQVRVLDEAAAMAGRALGDAWAALHVIANQRGFDDMASGGAPGATALAGVRRTAELSLQFAPAIDRIAVLTAAGEVCLGVPDEPDANLLSAARAVLGGYDPRRGGVGEGVLTPAADRQRLAVTRTAVGASGLRTFLIAEVDLAGLSGQMQDLALATAGGFALLDNRGTVLVGTPLLRPHLNARYLDDVIAAAPRESGAVQVSSPIGNLDAYVLRVHLAVEGEPPAGQDLVLLGAAPKGPLLERISALRQWAFILSGAAFAVGLVGAGLIARTVVHPLSAILAMTRRIARGEFGVTLPKARDDEIGQLVDAFNSMATSLAAYRDRLVLAETFAALGRVAATVAHEVRNPLNAIRGCVDYLRLKRPDDEVIAHHAAIIGQEIVELDGFVRDFLQATRVDAPQVAECDLWSVVLARVALHEPQAGSRGVSLDILAPTTRVTLPGDAHQLATVVENLLTNAIDAVSGGGRVEIAVAEVGRTIRLTVRDTGPGIPDTIAPLVFRPFFTTKPTGSGIGLAICARIVEAHGGRISFENQPGGGTCFAVDLPRDGRRADF